MLGAVLQGFCGGAYLGAAAGLLSRRASQWGLGLAGGAAMLHFGLVLGRWAEGGQLPIVSRYEDFTVDALVTVLLYLTLQWRWPQLRRPASLGLVFSGCLTLAALGYSRQTFPLGPALQTEWLLIHAQLNSLAVAAATLTASVGILWDQQVEQIGQRLLIWSLWLWSAMVAAGAYWASMAWGRFWAWDPIESWALATLLAYAVVIHLRQKPRQALRLSLLPYSLLLFTTYGLLLVMHSLHGSYLFQ